MGHPGRAAGGAHHLDREDLSPPPTARPSEPAGPIEYELAVDHTPAHAA
ncbi:hypothetical protein HMPREF0569_1457 [Micrococcus luteus SK58]|nr:hypothetical protein HMPREF0569_1457 [Micrococcus luteus SK58]